MGPFCEDMYSSLMWPLRVRVGSLLLCLLHSWNFPDVQDDRLNFLNCLFFATKWVLSNRKDNRPYIWKFIPSHPLIEFPPRVLIHMCAVESTRHFTFFTAAAAAKMYAVRGRHDWLQNQAFAPGIMQASAAQPLNPVVFCYFCLSGCGNHGWNLLWTLNNNMEIGDPIF